MSESTFRADLNGGELDCLTVLSHAKKPLRASGVYERLRQLREQAAQAAPALTTVSAYLRALLDKGVVREVTLDASGNAAFASATRGMIPNNRSPKTAYEPIYEPGVVLKETFKSLAQVFPPPDGQRQALVAFAQALDLPEGEKVAALVELARVLGFSEKAIKKLEKLSQEA